MLTAEDQLSIHALYARYAEAFDRGASEVSADCFTEDGSFTRANGVTSTGRDELRTMAEGVSGIRHLYANVLIEAVGPNEATVSCTNLRLRVADDGAIAIHALGVMRDRVVRTAVGWRFQRRTSSPT
ncbi:nuclear transport factor 2 family protein [Pseudonocardia spinosispora]|uniref:nuclear transport factor 2 family protein n=1 Tax=Pseudonocardia spinosispora TaxID=103441 RepID=UPI00040E4C16|nr:nuclear transport factor 2 family protein [Pseudonocardia spinosispora]